MFQDARQDCELCRGGLAPSFYVPQLKQFETRNTTLRELTVNARGEHLPEWWAT